ncbi:MAG TPA: CPBP family intramembrane glutamic endopeptidase [Tepidisphaeraceae bacterium]|jgi:membrane protease YdiL (CAAX protease family)|nr:CPBP family intramembrane glutamic endopeptidase [Tepidisphaeraceae bacterium]
MVILAQSRGPTATELAFLAVLTLMALAILWRGGVLRKGSVCGPARRTGHINTRPLLIILFAAITIWLGIQAGFFQYEQMKQTQSGGPAKFDPELMTAAEWAFLSVVPGIAGIIVIVIGHLGGKAGAAEELGFAPKQFLPGLGYGILGFIVVLPIVNWTLLFLKWFYDITHIKHPTEHELLRALGESGGTGAKLAIIAGATVIAPIFEEFIFRGHVQTVLVRVFARIRARRGLPLDLPLATSPDLRLEVDATPTPGICWLAILISSLLFAAIHAPWMAPAIFVLSICIGYVYQRTGNLWSAIIVHALFNIVNTIEFLSQTR